MRLHVRQLNRLQGVDEGDQSVATQDQGGEESERRVHHAVGGVSQGRNGVSSERHDVGAPGHPFFGKDDLAVSVQVGDARSQQVQLVPVRVLEVVGYPESLQPRAIDEDDLRPDVHLRRLRVEFRNESFRRVEYPRDVRYHQRVRLESRGNSSALAQYRSDQLRQLRGVGVSHPEGPGDQRLDRLPLEEAADVVDADDSVLPFPRHETVGRENGLQRHAPGPIPDLGRYRTADARTRDDGAAGKVGEGEEHVPYGGVVE